MSAEARAAVVDPRNRSQRWSARGVEDVLARRGRDAGCSPASTARDAHRWTCRRRRAFATGADGGRPGGAVLVTAHDQVFRGIKTQTRPGGNRGCTCRLHRPLIQYPSLRRLMRRPPSDRWHRRSSSRPFCILGHRWHAHGFLSGVSLCLSPTPARALRGCTPSRRGLLLAARLVLRAAAALLRRSPWASEGAHCL